ncbi:hypothetical protein ACJJTC_018378 [Scirpophaga incertulas]
MRCLFEFIRSFDRSTASSSFELVSNNAEAMRGQTIAGNGIAPISIENVSYITFLSDSSPIYTASFLTWRVEMLLELVGDQNISRTLKTWPPPPRRSLRSVTTRVSEDRLYTNKVTCLFWLQYGSAE